MSVLVTSLSPWESRLRSGSIQPPDDATLLSIVQKIAEITESNQQQLVAMKRDQPDPQDEQRKEALMEEIRRKVDSDQALRDDLARIAESLPRKQSRNDQLSGMSRELPLADPAKDREHLVETMGERTESTCEWILQDTIYQAWLKGNPSLLWLRGETGRCKTMLSTFLTNHLRTTVTSPKARLIYYLRNSQDDK